MTETQKDRITILQERYPFLTEDNARCFLVCNYMTGTDELQLTGDDLQQYLDEALERTTTLTDEQVKQFVVLFQEAFAKPETYARQVYGS